MKRMHPRAIDIEAYAWSTLVSTVPVQRPGRSRRLVRRLWISMLELLLASYRAERCCRASIQPADDHSEYHHQDAFE